MKKMTKKIISVVLSVLMVASMLPTFAMTAMADEAKDHYLFAYFTGNNNTQSNSSTSQAVRFATSEDGINFSPLNKNKPILAQETGTLNARDPYIFQGQDGAYYVIATDMDCKDWATYTSEAFVIWKSTDLISWTETNINVREILGEAVYKAWAPEVIWDDDLGAYMVYFALETPTKALFMYYMTTTDLLDQSKYTKPTMLYEAGGATIDADIVKQGDTYYMFYKDETVGRKTICLATSSAVNGPYNYVGVFQAASETGVLEGCEVYMIGDDYYLVADRFGDNGKFAIYNLGTDLSKLTTKGESISTTDGNPVTTVNATSGFQNLSVRHGSVLKITEAQANALNEAYPSVSNSKVENIGLIAEYFTDSNVTYDHTGNGHNLSNDGVAWWNASEHGGDWGSYGEDCAFLGQTTARTNNFLNNTGVTASTGFAISFKGFAYRTTDQQENRKFITIATADDMYWSGEGLRKGDGTFDAGFVSLASTGRLSSKTTDSNWDDISRDLANYDREWHDFLVSVNADEVAYYCDGALMATFSSNEALVNALINDGDLLIGRSSFKADPYLDGLMKNVRVYDHSCTPSDLADVSRETLIANNAVNWMQNSGADAITWLKDNAATSSVKSGNSVGYFVNDVATDYYSNLLYSQKDYVTWIGNGNGGSLTVSDIEYKLAVPARTVALYDGVTDITMPLKLEFSAKNNKNRYTHYIDSATNGFTYGTMWNYVTDSNNSYLYWNPTGSQNNANRNAGYSAGSVEQSKTENLKNTHAFYLNKVKFVPTFAQDSYYVKQTSLAVKHHFDSASNGNPENTVNTITNNDVNIYAINYKPIAEKYGAVKAMVAKVIGDEDDYCSTGLASFYKAAYNVLSLDPNSYFAGINDDQVDSAVQSCASAISTAAAKLSVATTEPVKHSWNDGEITTPATCQAAGEKTYTCSVCGDTYTEPVATIAHNYVKSVDGYVTTYTCNAGCGDSYIVDKTALAAAIISAEALKNEDGFNAKYTASSRVNFTQALSDAKTALADETIASTDDADVYTNALNTAQNNLVLTTLTATFIVVNEETGAEIESYEVSDINTGDTASYTYVIDNFVDGRYAGLPMYTVYKWTKTVKDTTTKLDSASTSLEVVVNENATYVLHLLPFSGTNEENNQTRVRYLDKSNKTIEISYVDKGSVVTPADVTAPTVPFYNFNGWECVFGDPDNAGDREIVFKATYVFDESEANKCNIIAVGNITVNGKTSDKVGYDKLVTLAGAGAYAYCEADGTIIAPINGSTIYAPHAETIYVTSVDTELEATALVTGDFITDNGSYNTLTVNAQYYVPSSEVADECGIEVTKNQVNWTKVKSNVQGTNHEYSIAMNYSVPGTLYVRPYVVVDGTTIYGSVVTIELV